MPGVGHQSLRLGRPAAYSHTAMFYPFPLTLTYPCMMFLHVTDCPAGWTGEGCKKRQKRPYTNLHRLVLRSLARALALGTEAFSGPHRFQHV